MESIISSIPSVQMAMWSAFTNGRELPGLSVRFEHDNNEFRFVCREKAVVVCLNRHTPQIRSASLSDYSPVIHKAWYEFSEKCAVIEEQNASYSLTAGGIYKDDIIPKAENEQKSVDVIIDVDGYRTTFRVGYYDLKAKGWVLYDKTILIDLDDMRWQALNINKRQ